MFGEILVVDDNPGWQHKLKAILEEDGFSIRTATDVEETLDAFLKHPIHVLVVGLKLDSDPSKDAGLALLEEVRRLGLNEMIYSIILTDHATTEYARNGFTSYGVIDFFEKHDFAMERDRFRQAVRETVARAKQARLGKTDRMGSPQEHLEGTEIPDQETHQSQDIQQAPLVRVFETIAHRINNEAGMIRLCVMELYESTNPEEDQVRSNLESIDRNNQRLLALASQLLKPVSVSDEELEPSNINFLVQEAINQADIPSDVELVLRCTNDLPSILANEWLVEAFVELISNAVRAMADSPTRALEVGSRRSKSHGIEVWFSDTGCGIDLQDRAKIFEIFYTSHSAKDNVNATDVHLGYGLWWVKTFVTELGGEIDFESKVGDGSTFFIRLPCSKSR